MRQAVKAASLRGVGIIVAVMVMAVAGCSGGSTRSNDGPSEAARRSSAGLRELTAASLTEWFACQEQLPIDDAVVYTAETDPNQLLGRPGQYTGKSTFVDTRTGRDAEAGVDAGASLELFDDVEAAEGRLAYLDEVTTAAPIFAEYHWLRDTVLLRVAHTLTPDQAAEYKRVLDTIPAGGVPTCEED